MNPLVGVAAVVTVALALSAIVYGAGKQVAASDNMQKAVDLLLKAQGEDRAERSEMRHALENLAAEIRDLRTMTISATATATNAAAAVASVAAAIADRKFPQPKARKVS